MSEHTRRFYDQMTRMKFSISVSEAVDLQEGWTARRVSHCHQQVSPLAIDIAVRASFLLLADTFRNYGLLRVDGLGEVERLRIACEQARAANPGFSEATYRQAESRLGWAMR